MLLSGRPQKVSTGNNRQEDTTQGENTSWRWKNDAEIYAAKLEAKQRQKGLKCNLG